MHSFPPPPPPPPPSLLQNKDFRSHLGIGTTQKAATHQLTVLILILASTTACFCAWERQFAPLHCLQHMRRHFIAGGRGIASPQTCTSVGPTNFCFDHSTPCNKLCLRAPSVGEVSAYQSCTQFSGCVEMKVSQAYNQSKSWLLSSLVVFPGLGCGVAC